MKKVERFNDTANYSNRAFDYGFRADHITEKPIYAAQELPITDGCIIQTAANVQLDEKSILLYEVVRSTPHAMLKLTDKVLLHLNQ